MSQRTFLGLTHNPFAAPTEGFFTGADRKTHLEHLRHLSQWSRRILVVTGPFGIGKSSLFRELSSNLEPQVKAARLAGTLVTTEREILDGMLQGFGVAADSESGADDLSAVLAAFIDEQNESGRACMAMVDDGHMLEAGALQRLISLVAKSSLRLVVFAETSAVGAIDNMTRREELEWFEIRLTGFPKTEVSEYLEWRFSQAEYRGILPFSEEQMEKIVAKSSGNPGVIDSLSSSLLIEMETGGSARRRGFPMTHLVLATMLLAVSGLVYFYFSREPEPEPQIVLAQAEPSVSIQSPAVADEVETSVPAGGQADAQAEKEAEKDAEKEPETNTATNRTPSEGPNTASDLPVEQPDDERRVEVEEQTPTQDLEVTTTSGTDETDAVEVLDLFGGESPSAEPAIDGAGRPPEEPPVARDAQPEDVATSQVTEQVAPQTQPVIPVVEASAAISVSTPANSQAAPGGIKDGQWLLGQNARRFTVQLVTVSKLERAYELIQEQADPAEFAVYQINRDGRRLNVITYGVFTSEAAAQTATNDIQGQLKAVKPWIRPMNLVQDAVRGGLR